MSGIEVVGVVLGAIPLTVSALEHQRSILSWMDMLVHFDVHYRKILDDNRDEGLVYRLQLKKLLLPLVRDELLAEEELNDMILDAGNTHWKDAGLNKALKIRLRDCHENCVELLSEIQALAWRLLKPLAQSSGFERRFEDESAGDASGD